MLDYFDDIYRKRVNRYGDDYQSRLQGKREAIWERELARSPYRVTFHYKGNLMAAELIPKSVNDTKSLQTLLTSVSQPVSPGTIIHAENNRQETSWWMVYYEEETVARGYNRYTVIEMTHNISWVNKDETTGSSMAYFYGQEDNMLKNDLKSRSRANTIYSENLKLNFFIMPITANIAFDSYMEVEDIAGTIKEPYRVTGYDRQSTEGVMYVTVNPIYEFDKTPAPQKQPGDNDEDYFWLEGGD